jgi:hypothetical protein
MNHSIDVFENSSCHDFATTWPTTEPDGIHPRRRYICATNADSVLWTDSKEFKRPSYTADPSSGVRVSCKNSSPSTKVLPAQTKRDSYETIPQLLWFHESDSSLDLSSSEEDDDADTRGRMNRDIKATPPIGPLLSPGRRHVHFDGHVSLREYSITIGDHPSCEDALPLTLDWAYVETTGPLCPNGEGPHIPVGSTDTTWSPSDDTTPRDGSLIQIRPLTMAERRHRLIHVGAYTAEEVDTYLQQYYSGGYIYSVILELFTRCFPNRLFLGQPQSIQ